MADWFYDESGAHRGPVTEANLRALLADGFVGSDTRVWTHAFGEQWRPASQTELASSIRGGGPPPLGLAPAVSPPSNHAAGPPLGDAPAVLSPIGYRPSQNPSNAPYAPPLPAQGVSAGTPFAGLVETTRPSPTYARLIAFYPLFLIAVEIAFGLNNMNPNLPPVSTGLAFWSFVISLGFARGDANAIARAGLNPKGKWMVPFMLLTPVGYLIRRKVVAGVSLTPLWIWLGCGVLYVLVSAALFN